MKRDHEAAFLRSLTCAVFAVERQLVFLFCEKATVFLRNVSTVSYVHVFLRRCPSAACLADLLAPIPRLSFSVAFASIGVARIRRFWRAFWTVSLSCRVRFLFVCFFFFSCDWIACGCVYLTYLDVGDGYGGVVPRSLVDVVRASVAIVSCGDLHAARWGGWCSFEGWMDGSRRVPDRMPWSRRVRTWYDRCSDPIGWIRPDPVRRRWPSTQSVWLNTGPRGWIFDGSISMSCLVHPIGRPIGIHPATMDTKERKSGPYYGDTNERGRIHGSKVKETIPGCRRKEVPNPREKE